MAKIRLVACTFTAEKKKLDRTMLDNDIAIKRYACRLAGSHDLQKVLTS